MKMKKLLVVTVAFVFACSLVQAVGAKLAYHWGWDMPGDVNGDGKVDMTDIGIVAKAFGSYPGSPNWNPNADINLDGKVDVRDLSTVGKEFGLYVKKEVDYQAIATMNVLGVPVPVAGAGAQLFILSNNMFYASVQFHQIVPAAFTVVNFAVGQEGSGIQGAQDDRAQDFSYWEGTTFTAFWPIGLPWYAKAYQYSVTWVSPTQDWFKFEMWGSLSGTTTWTMLEILTGSDIPPFVDVDFQVVLY